MKNYYVWLDKIIEKYFRGKNVFREVALLKGVVFRQQKNRITMRFMLGNKSYFIKIHRGIGYGEVIKNFLQGRMPIFNAKNEWNAIHTLNKLNILTPTIVGYGKKGFNPLTMQSFIITKELIQTVSLEYYCNEWHKNPLKPKIKNLLIDKVAEITRILHQNNIHHRDLYICHFLLDVSGGLQNITPHNLKLFLIDMHRTIIYKKNLPKRRQMSDLIKLYFSILLIKPTKRDLLRFIKKYTNQPLKNCLKNKMWKQIERGAEKLVYKLDKAKTETSVFI